MSSVILKYPVADLNTNADAVVDLYDLTKLIANWQSGVANPLGSDLNSILAQLGLPTVIPSAKGSYSGTSTDTRGRSFDLGLNITKQANRGTFASLHGNLTLRTRNLGRITATITSGKIQNSGLRISIAATGSAAGKPFTLTISGTSNVAGSQIQGTYTCKSAFGTERGSLVANKT